MVRRLLQAHRRARSQAQAHPSSLHGQPAGTGERWQLGRLTKGAAGVVTGIAPIGEGVGGALSPHELERRLLEIGFVEGASIEVLHEGWIGRDPIAVRVNDHTVALCRAEANAVLVETAA
jgi:ferrous iron transport protein A